MRPVLASAALPFLALALTLVALVATTLVAHRRGRFARRPSLLAALLLGALPLVYVELVWARAFAGSYVRFARPEASPLCAFALGYVALRLGELGGSQSRLRRVSTETLLVLSALAASLAVLGPELGAPLDNLTVLLVVDRSRSIDLVPGADALVRAQLDVAERSMREGDRVGVVVFAADAATEDPPRPRGVERPSQRMTVGRDATDIGAGVRRALAELPADAAARLVLVTDGVATRGDPLAAAAAAVAAGVPVDALALDQRSLPDVRVVALRMPARADEHEPLELRVVTASPQATEVEVRVKRDGELVARGSATIAAGEDVLRLAETAQGAGLHRYDVEITAKDAGLDQAPEDNAVAAFVRVRGPSSALVLEGEAGKGEFVANALRDAAFRVTTAGAASVPEGAAGLASYDLVVFSDISAADLAPSQIEGLAAYAKDLGGGLLLLGGDRSMGPGGYAKTALEEVSPVSFDLKQERRSASLAEVIAIDYSGSMGAMVGKQNKLDLANEAAARSAALLGPGDRLGVAHVDTSVSWTIRLSPVADPADIAHRVRAVGVGGGGIYVDIALDEGYAALARENANLKHLLLFADGSDAERMTGCRPKVQDAARRGITTSVVALGKGSDVPELETLSKLGGGRFYLIEDATRLPAVFAQETILASKSAIHEGDFRASPGAPGPATRGIDFGLAPALKGYVIAPAKARATTHLFATDGDPLLATWSVGVGRAGAFTSDLKDRWGVAWTGWPGASRMLGQLGRDLARKADDPRVRLESDASGGELHVRATVVGDDGRAATFRRLAARVTGPDGVTRALPLEAVGAGAYAVTTPLSRPGTYVTTAVDEVSNEVVGTTGAAMNAGEELRPTGTDRALLSRLTSMTGGKVRDSLSGVFGDRPARRFAYTPLTSLLVVVAGAALLSSVAARRLAWGGVFERLANFARGPNRPSTSRGAAPTRTPDATATALLQAKARANTTTLKPVRLPNDLAPTPPVRTPLAPISASTPRPAEPPQRAKTAAEILLEKRRGRQG